MTKQQRTTIVERIEASLQQRLEASTDHLEQNLASLLLERTTAQREGSYQDPTLAALLSVTTPTIGAEYRSIIAELYYQMVFSEPSPAHNTNLYGKEQSLTTKVARCLREAVIAAQALHSCIGMDYTKELLQQITKVETHSPDMPNAVMPRLQEAITAAHTVYQVTNHPGQSPETREASKHAAAMRASLILTQALVQAYNRNLGAKTLDLNGHSATAPVHGKFLFHHHIYEKVKGLHGHFVVIDVRTGDYETSPEQAVAHRELRKRRPDAFCWVERIGAANPYEEADTPGREPQTTGSVGSSRF